MGGSIPPDLSTVNVGEVATPPPTLAPLTDVLTYYQVIVKTASSSTLKMTANLTQILNFKANFHKEFKLLKNIF